MELNLTNFDLIFPTDEACIQYLAEQRWPHGIACIFCGSVIVYAIKRRSAYECKDCGKQFNARTGTPFENSVIPMRKWFRALHLLTSSKRGISSVQLAHELGVSQPTAWSMMHRLRAVMHLDFERLEGIVEADETYFAPRIHRRTDARHRKQIAVLGIVEKAKGRSRVRVLVTKHVDASTALPFIRAAIKQGTRVFTDGSRVYHRLGREFPHQKVNHSIWQWCDGEITTNGIESFWSHLKRGIFGTYLQVSHKYLQRYADEYAYKHNTRWMTQRARFGEWFGGLDQRKCGCPSYAHSEQLPLSPL